MNPLFILLIIFLFFLARYFLLPYKKYLFYRKYGKGHFFPIFGEILKIIESQKKYGDADYLYQHIQDKGDD